MAELESIKNIFDIEFTCQELYLLVGTTGGLSLIALDYIYAVRATYMMMKISTSLSKITKKTLACLSQIKTVS